MPPKSRSRRASSSTTMHTTKPEDSDNGCDLDDGSLKRKRAETPPLIVKGSRNRKPSRRLLESDVAQSYTGHARVHKARRNRVESSVESDFVVNESNHVLPSFSGTEQDSDDVDSSDSDVERNSDGVPVELVQRREITTTDIGSSKAREVLLASDTVYLQDVVSPSFIPPPKDETRVDNRDKLIRKAYNDIVNLPAASLLSSGQGRTAQTASLDLWYRNGGTINVAFLRDLYMFSHDDSFVNLSRVDPGLLSTRRVSSITNNLGLVFANRARKDSAYAMCVSIIHVTDCSLYIPRRPFTLDGTGLRVIEGDFLVQEFERLLGCLGVVYRTSTFGYDLFTSHFQFRTYVERQSENRSDNASRTPDRSSSKYAVTVASPRSITTSSPARLAVSATEQIPVYDFTSRKRPFDPTIDLYPAKTNAPVYDRDIPEGSLALVAYTVNTYNRKTDLSNTYLSFNVHWAALIGTLAR